MQFVLVWCTIGVVWGALEHLHDYFYHDGELRLTSLIGQLLFSAVLFPVFMVRFFIKDQNQTHPMG